MVVIGIVALATVMLKASPLTSDPKAPIAGTGQQQPAFGGHGYLRQCGFRC